MLMSAEKRGEVEKGGPEETKSIDLRLQDAPLALGLRDPAHQQDRRSKSRSTRKRKRVGCPLSFMFVHLAVALVLPTSLDPEYIPSSIVHQICVQALKHLLNPFQIVCVFFISFHGNVLKRCVDTF